MNIKVSRGFSLLEIVVSMLILSLVVAGLFGLFVTSHKFITEAGHRLQAINCARQVAETLKVYVSATSTVGTGTSQITNAGTGSGCALENGTKSLTPLGLGNNNSFTIDGVTYTIDPDDADTTANGYTVNDVSVGGSSTDLKEVTIRVRWPSES